MGVGVIHRRAFLTAVTLSVAVAPRVGEAQPARKIPRVGVLGGQSPESSPAILSFLDGLRELGYVVGRDIVVEWRWAAGQTERYPEMVAQLLKLDVDVIVAPTTAGAQAAHKATRSVPIVMGFVNDPIALGFVTSLARPGGNVTGVGVPNPEIAGKRLQLLREITPGMPRVACLSDPGQLGGSMDLSETEAAARALGLELGVWPVRSAQALDRIFAEIARRPTAGVVVAPSGLLYAVKTQIARLAVKHRLPAMGWTRELAESGCLTSYGASQRDLARRAAYFVDRILKGTKPADIPVEQPSKYELVINATTAKAIGLTVPPAVLGRADQIIG